MSQQPNTAWPANTGNITTSRGQGVMSNTCQQHNFLFKSIVFWASVIAALWNFPLPETRWLSHHFARCPSFTTVTSSTPSFSRRFQSWIHAAAARSPGPSPGKTQGTAFDKAVLEHLEDQGRDGAPAALSNQAAPPHLRRLRIVDLVHSTV